MNELEVKNQNIIKQETTFSYDYQPAILHLHDVENRKELAEKTAEHYMSLVFQNVQECNDAHRELNYWINGLEDARKRVKNEYNKPLEQFEQEIKEILEPLKKAINKVKEERDEYLEAERELRQEIIDEYINKKIKGTAIDFEKIEQPTKWTNKGSFTEKLNIKKAIKDEINSVIEEHAEEHKKLLAEKEVLTKFFEQRNIAPDYYLQQLEDGRTSSEIMQEILELEEQEKIKPQEQEIKEETIEEETVEEIIDDSPFANMTATLNFTVTGKEKEIKKLKAFLKELGVQVTIHGN